MRIYLDNCCFNRPFDDQRHTRIRLETEAKLHIQEKIREGVWELCWSYVLDFENGANPYAERRRTIAAWRAFASLDVDETETVVQQALVLKHLELQAKDALHVACAISGGCDYFVTTDDMILKRTGSLDQIRVLDPPSLIRELNV